MFIVSNYCRIPNSSCCCCTSQKPPHGAFSGTKHGIMAPLVSKRLEKILRTNQNLKNTRKKKQFRFLEIFGFLVRSWISLRLFLDFSVIFWISLLHYPIIAPLRGSHGLSARRAWSTKSRVPKGLHLEVGARRTSSPDIFLSSFLIS